MIYTIAGINRGERNIIKGAFGRIPLGLFYLLVMLTVNTAYGIGRDTVVVCGPASLFSKMANGIEAGHCVPIAEEDIRSLSAQHVPLLILALQKSLDPASLVSIDQYVRSGGNVIVLGPAGTSISNRPVAVKVLADYRNKKTYSLTIREHGAEEKPEVTSSIDQYGHPALRFQTFRRGINDVRLTFDCSRINVANKQLLQINAKGDAYMDLLYIEATDQDGQIYCTFLPLAPFWKTYSVPLANLIATTAEDSLFRGLRSQKIKTIAIGTNRKTIWPEKPMAFSIGQVGLACNYLGTSGPTPALNQLTVPFAEIGLKLPFNVFSPFYGSKEKFAQRVYIPGNPTNQFSVQRAWTCPPPFNDFPGVGMGTDHKQEFDTRDSHSVRRVQLLKAVGSDQALAELRYYAGGVYKGSSVAIFGLDLEEVADKPWFWTLFKSTVHKILREPHIYRIQMNTVTDKAGASVVPLVHITLGNPLDKETSSKISVRIAGGKTAVLSAHKAVDLAADSLFDCTLVLDEVPEDFDFKKFNWSVVLQSNFGEDIWRDTIDVERIVLQAGLHMIQVQKHFPDGRMSNHYFADAYGARALFAYFRYLEDHPERLYFNGDIWRQTNPEEFKQCAERFCDMLVRRQRSNGAVPMGYSEQSGSFNVADGGQISLGLGEVGLMELDPLKRRAYLKSSKRIIDYAESYYIDSALFLRLEDRIPSKVKDNHTLPGFYGLGVYSGGVRREYGPVWVLSDILTTQALLSFIYPQDRYLSLLKRNIHTYLPNAHVNSGWYQAEAMIWSWLAISNKMMRSRIKENLTHTFLPTLLTGKQGDMFDFGGRGSLRLLPLLYYRRLFGDSPGLRAVVLKYVWTAGSESRGNSVAGLRVAYPVPHHGASLAAIKYSEFSSIWAMELLDPGATLIKEPLN